MPDQKKSVTINPNAKAVLPTGKTVDRGEILKTLGLNPNTAPDAWLTIVACGGNASALHPGDAQELINKGTLTAGHADLGAALSRLRVKGGN